MRTYKTTIVGIGPYCVEFDDGEIITTRVESRQSLIAAAPELLDALKYLMRMTEECDTPSGQGVGRNFPAMHSARAAIAKAEGKR